MHEDARAKRSAARKRFLTLATGLPLLAMGCGRAADDFEPPFFRVQEEIGLCGSGILVDAQKEVWTESGCEDGAYVYHPQGRVDDATFARIQEAFQALPAEPGPDCEADQRVNGFEVDVRLFWAEAARSRTWNPCTTEGELTAPYKAAADALQEASQQVQ
jgi:hypothetical protein